VQILLQQKTLLNFIFKLEILEISVKSPVEIRSELEILINMGLGDEQSGTGSGLLRVLRFPLPIIPPITPLSALSIQGW
jgi:hypothetical protein